MAEGKRLDEEDGPKPGYVPLHYAAREGMKKRSLYCWREVRVRTRRMIMAAHPYTQHGRSRFPRRY